MGSDDLLKSPKSPLKSPKSPLKLLKCGLMVYIIPQFIMEVAIDNLLSIAKSLLTTGYQ